jgi:NHS family xanthosine MFS transporter
MELIIVSQALHGFCFSCSYAAAYIYIDRVASPDVRNSAQTGFGVILLGIGPILGGTLNGFLEQVSTVDGVLNYGRFWYACAGIGLAAGIVLICLFHDESEDVTPETVGETDDA